MATDWPLVLLVLGMCVVPTSAQCQECFDKCGLLFDGPEWGEISIYDKLVRFFAYDCAFLQSLSATYPDLRMTIVSDADLGNINFDTKFGVVGDMMDNEDTTLEIVDLDNPWVMPLADKLETLPEDVYDGMRETYLIRDDDGGVKSLSWIGNSLMLFYRKDLFDMHNIAYTTETWESWTEAVKLLQEKEQERRNDSNWRAMAFAAGNTDLSMYTSFFLTFLSGHDGGTIIADDGEPTIANANAIKTMNMMVDWKETIMHQKSWVSSSYSDMVGNSEVAIAIEWNWYSEWSPEEVVVSSIPGATGRSLSGCLMAAITKHTRRKDVAFDILRQIVKNRPAFESSTRSWFGGFRDETTEPVHKDTLNATMWPKYCTGQPRLCKAYETYPEKFEAPMIQRLRGCGPLFDRCINVVATGWLNLMVEEMPPAQVVATMSTQLRAVMGISTSGDEAAGIEEWTDERIALIVVAIVAGFWILVLAWFTHDKLSGLRKSNGLRLPASVVLGIVVLILFCIVQVIITLEWNTAVRRISEDLGSRVQVVLLKTARLSLERSAENKMEEQMALSQMKSLVKADYVSQLPSMRIDPRSLILLIDLDEETVVVSSDTRKQADKVSIAVPYSDEVTNWMHAAFDAVGPSLTGFKTEQLYSSTVGSEKVNVNLQLVSLRREYNPGDYKNMNYVLIYFVPEEVVYEETTKSLNRAVNLSILLAIAGVVLLVTLAVISTLPLIRLAMDMEEVRSMRMDDIDLTQNSRLIEFSSLIVGFQAMCEMLSEYKSFMPKTLFKSNSGSDEDEDSEKVTSTHSHHSRSRSSAFGSSSRNQSENLMQHSKVTVTKQHLQVGEAAINQTRGTLLAVRLLLDEKDLAVKSFETLLAAIERSIGNGVLHSFNTTVAEELIVTWGVAGNPMGVRTTQERAAHAALGIKHLMSAEKMPVTMAAISARFSAGNVGSKRTRGFAVFGAPIRLLPTMMLASKCISQTMSATAIVVNSEMSKVQGFSFNLVDSIIGKNGTSVFYELFGTNQVTEQEWMYQLQEVAKQASRTFETYLGELLSKTEADMADVSKIVAVPSHTVSEQIDVIQKIRLLLDPLRMLQDIPICSLIERRSAALVAENAD